MSSRIISEVVDAVRSNKLDKNSGRRAAVFVNGTVALSLALRTASTQQARQSRDTLGNSQISSTLSTYLMVWYHVPNSMIYLTPDRTPLLTEMLCYALQQVRLSVVLQV